MSAFPHAPKAKASHRRQHAAETSLGLMQRFHPIPLIGAALYGLLSVACAQGPSVAIPPKELDWLNSQVGVWNTAQTFRITPEAPIFHSTSTESIRWSESREFLLVEQRGLTVAGLTSRIVVISWSPSDRQIHAVEVQTNGNTHEDT